MKITINADAYAITSDLKVADIELLKKYDPDALKVKDEDGNEKFAVSYQEGKACIAPFGVTFGGVSRDGEGKATITGAIPSEAKTTDAAKNYIAEKIGGVIAYLRDLEESVPAAAEAVRANRQSIIDAIDVA